MEKFKVITAAEREKAFREALSALLERHKAEIEITDDAAGWGMHSAIAVITMPTIFDDNGDVIADYTEFQL